MTTREPVTTDALTDARAVAAQHGLTIQSARRRGTDEPQAGALAVGMVLALGILAMTVGLIRSESAVSCAR